VKNKMCPTFSLTQGANSAIVSLFRIPGKRSGFWKSGQPNFDFRDTGHGNQYMDAWGLVTLYCDVGQVDSVGQGHTISLSNADDSSRMLMMAGVYLDTLKAGDQGSATMFFVHSHAFTPGLVNWEYTGMQMVKDWQVEDSDY
jgi:hypothetical protein